ncbi:MAG: hypothetical protein L6W00_26695 [Lentisphaeria bacterium]|nr:MAG: hypothetical protein L6W00_26695 [Lentisphaeria bacterium]
MRTRCFFEPEEITDFYFGTTDEAEENAAEFRLAPDMKPTSSISICDPLDVLMRQPCIRRAALPGFNGFASARALARFYRSILAERYFSRGDAAGGDRTAPTGTGAAPAEFIRPLRIWFCTLGPAGSDRPGVRARRLRRL